MWVDSATAAHNISETQSRADHRTHKRIDLADDAFRFGIRLIELITVINPNAMPDKLL